MQDNETIRGISDALRDIGRETQNVRENGIQLNGLDRAVLELTRHMRADAKRTPRGRFCLWMARVFRRLSTWADRVAAWWDDRV